MFGYTWRLGIIMKIAPQFSGYTYGLFAKAGSLCSIV